MNIDKKKIKGNVDSVRDRLSIKWVSVITTIVIIFSLGIIALSIFSSDKYSALQYRVTIALVCFVLSTISALLFVARVEIKATIGFIGITIVGPAAMWLASLLIFSAVFQDPGELSNDLWIEKIEKSEGWETLKGWKSKIGNVYELFTKSNGGKFTEEFTKIMLSRVYYHGDDAKKLKNVSIQTLFINLGKNKRIKLQIIKGEKAKDIANIYTPAFPSYEPQKSIKETVSGCYFFRVKDEISGNYRITKQDKIEHGSWVEVNDKFIDCLFIAIYYEPIDKGDWIYIDLPKYVDDTANKKSNVILTVIASEEMSNFQAWEMCGSQRIYLSPAPLLFRREQNIRCVESIDESIKKDLSSWFEFLDSKIKSSGIENDLKKFLELVISEINNYCNQNQNENISLTELLSICNKEFKYRFLVKNDQCENGLLSIFRWNSF